jgi:hypothetical protein
MSTSVAMTPTTAGDNIPISQPRFTSIFPLNIPIILAALTPIEIKITAHEAIDPLIETDFLKIGLNGMLVRSA